MEDWTATTRHRITRKSRIKGSKAFRQSPGSIACFQYHGKSKTAEANWNRGKSNNQNEK